MALNLPIQVYRGTRAGLASLASSGHQGVLAWTTDTNEVFVDSGTGSGIGTAWLPIANSIAVFTAASQAAMLALAAKVGDLCDRTDLKQIFILTAAPASTLGNWTALSPDASVTGIQGLSAGTANQFVTFIDNSGVQHLAQPDFTNLSGRATVAQLPATIDCGTF